MANFLVVCAGHYGRCGGLDCHPTNARSRGLSGDDFKQQGHLRYDEESNYPLSTLYLHMLQKFSIEAKSFGPSTSSLSEICSAETEGFLT